MKKIVYTIIICLTAVSCEKFLDIKPYGKTIPQTAEEFSALLHSILEEIDYGEEYIIGNVPSALNFECYAENLEASITEYPAGNFLPLYVGSHLSNKQSMYKSLYATVKDCNIIIEYINNKDSRLSQEVLGTAYALRGICYYNLLRNFCDPCIDNNNGLGVPLVTKFDMEETPVRSTIGATITRIEKDLNSAISYNIEDPIYRFNSDIMEAYLARLYFWTGQYENAAIYAKKTVEKYPLLSGDDYVAMMDVDYSYAPKHNMLLKSGILSDGGSEYSSAQSTIKARPVSKRFIDLFNEKENDIRYAMSFTDKRVVKKKLISCIRSAEMQLVLAESLYHSGDEAGALAALNDLRRNRITGYTDLTMESLPAVNEDDIIKQDAKGNPLTPLLYAILCERRKELFMEGDRWYELKRNGRPEFWVAKQGRKYTTMQYMYTFPLPVEDIKLVDGLIQNPGYDKTK